MALLIGYGAGAINPYLAFESIEDLIAQGLYGLGGIDPHEGDQELHQGGRQGRAQGDVEDGHLDRRVVLRRPGVRGDRPVARAGRRVLHRHRLAARRHRPGRDRRGGRPAPPASPTRTGPDERAHRDLELGGEYQWRREGEYHLFNPDTVFKLQHATRAKRYDVFKEYTRLVDDQSKRLATLRGLFTFRDGLRPPVPIDEVEPVSEIVKRFATGAMSYGSISKEAHETLAIAMNRIGGKSNTGEGGEDADRYVRDANGDLRRSAIKQVASGRFGVTSEYLVNADDLQIKMAQGAKPGEGGQLPGHKVYPWIAQDAPLDARRRPDQPAAAPRHLLDRGHQAAHPRSEELEPAGARPRQAGGPGRRRHGRGGRRQGASSDVVLISGHDGGTGASPLTSIKHAGAPWELGIAETQQTLLKNGLRDRIVVQCDGQLKTGRDVVIAALLGAEEFGFASAPLVVSGCVMMRVCHLDTCPVGVATQNPVLAQALLGQAGVRGQLLRVHRRGGARASGGARLPLDRRGGRARRDARHAGGRSTTGRRTGSTSRRSSTWPRTRTPARRCSVHAPQDHGLDEALDQQLIALAEPALELGQPVDHRPAGPQREPHASARCSAPR